MHESPIFAIDTISVSELGDTIVREAQDQLHSDSYNLDTLTTGLNNTVQQLPATLGGPVQQFVSHFESNYKSLLNQRVVIGQILEGKVAPAAQQSEMQITDTFQ